MEIQSTEERQKTQALKKPQGNHVCALSGGRDPFHTMLRKPLEGALKELKAEAFSPGSPV